MIFSLLRILSCLMYLISAIFYYRFFNERRERSKRYARIGEGIALLVHTYLLFYLTWTNRHLPLADAPQAITTFMWFFAILNKIYIREKKEYSLGIFHTSIVFVLQAIAMIFIDPRAEMPEILKNVSFEIHVIVNLIAYASFSSAFLAGIMYILLFHEFRGNRLGYFYERLPSLSYLETFNFRAIMIGFILNLAGIVLGVFTGKTAWGTYWAWDPKLIAVLIGWVIYGVALLGHLRLRWQGNRLAYLSITGFIWILFSMLIINNYFSTIHSFN